MFMNRLRKKWIALFLVITLFAGMVMPVSAANGVTTADYGALLDSYSAGSGTFKLTTSSRMFVVSETEPKGELLQTAQLINREFAAKGYPSPTPLDLVWGPLDYAKTGDVVLYLDTTSGTGAEGYKLKVTADTATVTATDEDGLLYGANSLMKFFMVDGEMNLTAFTAADTPDTKERTVMLDTGRKYYTVEWICNFIRQISWMGYNSIQVHVSEDGGFRADFWDPAYYKGNFQPENDFTWLCGSHVQSWVYNGNKTNPDYKYREDPNEGDYLTTAELVKICEVAKEYHIDIIPSFDSPAHMDYITWKFEQNYNKNGGYSFKYNEKTYSSTNGCINYTGRTGASSPSWPYYTTIDITDGTVAKAFVFALYEDMADFFKEYAGSKDFSLGADEVNLSSKYGPKWDYSQFPGYVNDLNRILNNKGYTCRMFNDFIGSKTYNFNESTEKCKYPFDSNIEIMYWNSDFNPSKIGSDGKKVWDEPIWHVKFFWENNTGTTDNWGDGGRVMYNCIQTNCYYVLRVANAVDSTNSNYMKDARNPNNTNWTFYHSTEEDIYNEWYPADISEKGIYKEDAADVPADQLGGAYFLIWNDYAALNTEAEVWNGASDTTGTNNGVTYYLFDRMYSNIIKMWNSDINSSVTYDEFKDVREVITGNKQVYFPGYTSCSATASLPVATPLTQAYLSDHSALNVVLESGKISNEESLYIFDSYTVYETAYDNAVDVNKDYGATEAEIANAISTLKSATAALKVKDLNVYYKSSDNETLVSETYNPDKEGNYSVNIDISQIEALNGYIIEKIDVSDKNTGSSTIGTDKLTATISGNIKNNCVSVAVWVVKDSLSLKALEAEITKAEKEITDSTIYTTDSWIAYTTALSNAKIMLTEATSNPDNYKQSQIDECTAMLVSAATSLEKKATDLSKLNTALNNPIEEQGNYTDKTWSAYTLALENAQKAEAEPENYTQAEVDAFAAALTSAREALKDKSEVPDTSIESVVKLTATSRKNRPIGILVKTTEDVTNITVTLNGEAVKLSSLTNGKAMLADKATEGKLWLAKFYAPAAAGNYTYTVMASGIADDVNESVTVTVR